jgi:hypothetical protein
MRNPHVADLELLQPSQQSATMAMRTEGSGVEDSARTADGGASPHMGQWRHGLNATVLAAPWRQNAAQQGNEPVKHRDAAHNAL